MQAEEFQPGEQASGDQEQPRGAQSLFWTDTEHTACSLEFCPSKPNVFVCGLYETVKMDPSSTEPSPETKRVGRCLLFEESSSQDDSRLEWLV